MSIYLSMYLKIFAYIYIYIYICIPSSPVIGGAVAKVARVPRR